MLQQTQVATVTGYYTRFVGRFPDVFALAGADIDEVLRHWSGLGYYGRARNLHAQRTDGRHRARRRIPARSRVAAAAARHRTLDRGGDRGVRVRRTRADPRRQRQAGVLQGFRRRGLPGRAARRGSRSGRLPQRELPRRGIEAYTQGLMDLGATLCTRAGPRCGDCPLAAHCDARLTGRIRGAATAAPRAHAAAARCRPGAGTDRAFGPDRGAARATSPTRHLGRTVEPARVRAPGAAGSRSIGRFGRRVARCARSGGRSARSGGRRWGRRVESAAPAHRPHRPPARSQPGRRNIWGSSTPARSCRRWFATRSPISGCMSRGRVVSSRVPRALSRPKVRGCRGCRGWRGWRGRRAPLGAPADRRAPGPAAPDRAAARDSAGPAVAAGGIAGGPAFTVARGSRQPRPAGPGFGNPARTRIVDRIHRACCPVHRPRCLARPCGGAP